MNSVIFMKLIIIRHGDPDYEHDTLTPKGVREAKLLSERISKLDVKAFYCSPLGRAQDTASYTLDKMNRSAQTLPWLCEFEGKILSGLKYVSCWDRLPSEWTKYPEHYDYNEWYNSKIMRQGNIYKVNNSNHDTIVLFCHFGVECVLLSHIMSCSPMVFWHNFVALPTSVTTLITEEREKGIAAFRCQQFGDISHLYAGGEEPSFAARFCECFDDDTRH